MSKLPALAENLGTDGWASPLAVKAEKIELNGQHVACLSIIDADGAIVATLIPQQFTTLANLMASSPKLMDLVQRAHEFLKDDPRAEAQELYKVLAACLQGA